MNKLQQIYKLMKAFEYQKQWHNAIKDPEILIAAYEASDNPLVFENFKNAVAMLEKELIKLSNSIEQADC